MQNDYSQWDALGRSIEDIVDRAVSSRDFQKLNQSIRQAVAMGAEALRNAGSSQGRVIDAQPASVSTPEALYANTGSRTAGNIFKLIGGGFLCGLAGMMVLFGMFLQWAMIGGGGLFLVLALLPLAGGSALIGSGCAGLRQLRRFKRYLRLLDHKTHYALDKLARATGKSAKFVTKDLARMIDAGLFREGHIDYDGAFLITSHETYREFERSRLLLQQRQVQPSQPPKKAGEDPRLKDILNRGNAFIAEIRRCNDAIPGEEISAKIDRTETIVRRIFQRAKDHPEIVDDLKKLMDYYLPMTVKLLQAYADMDAQPVQGTTIAASKREIEDTLDTLNLAFEKLLDDLFKDTAMDVSSDISVLQTLLAQEGLMDDELAKLRKDNL